MLNPMLVEVELPFADLRAFLDADSGRLGKPGWPYPDPSREFVRSTGEVELRRKGAIDPWGDERCYCSAVKAIRFPDRLHEISTTESWSRCCFQAAFRRVFFDGKAVGRFSVGLSSLTATPVGTAISALATPVTIGDGDTLPLANAGLALSQHWLANTTAAASLQHLDNGWVLPGLPLAVVEEDGWHGYYGADPADLVGHEVDVFEPYGVSATFRRMSIGGRSVELWTLLSETNVEPDRLRRIRLHLTRLHTEREALKAVFRAIRVGSISPDRGSDALQAFLNRALSWQDSKKTSGVPSREILAAAEKAHDLVTEGERDHLLSSITELRGNIQAKVKATTAHTTPVKQPIYVEIGTVNMSDHSTNVEGEQVSGVVGGTGNTVGSISNNLTYIQGSEAAPELKALLEELNNAFAPVLAKVAPEVRTAAEAELSELTREALDPSATPEKIESRMTRLWEHAKSAGAVGASAIALLSELLKLLG